MGAALVTAAYAFVRAHNERARTDGGRELEPIAVALLALMGHTAVDEHPEPRYFAAWTATAGQLGLPPTETGRKRMQRAVDALIQAGAIHRVKRGHRGSTALYRLSYAKGTRVSRNPESETPVSHSAPDSGTPASESGTPVSKMRDTGVPPRKEEEPKEEGTRAPARDTPSPSRFCPAHPAGTTLPCIACRDARLEHDKRQRALAAARRQPARELVEVDGRNVCANLPHELLADGTCRHCEIRAEDLTGVRVAS